MSETHNNSASMIDLGFWTYIMTDCMLFGTLFATYAVLHNSTYGGPTSKELFDPFYALMETLILLVSSFTCGLAGIAARRNDKKKIIFWFTVTFLLGLSFVVMEGIEFTKFVREGASWQRSAFLSSFFTLVGTHGTHISIGLIWMVVMMFQVAFKGITPFTERRMSSLRLFWHFLDIVWIFIFTLVYMMGAA